MGRIIYTTRDDEYRDFGREMRGTTDNMQSALCLDVMGGRYIDADLWRHPLRCDKAEVRRDCEFRFGGIDKRPVARTPETVADRPLRLAPSPAP